jgi:hypothetical protein
VALTYRIDIARRLVIITGDYAAAAEWHELLGRVLADPSREPGFGFLRDLRDAKVPVDAATVVGIIDVVKRFWPMLQVSKAAIVTPRDMDSAAVVAQALGDTYDLPIRVFRELEEALRWLT